MTYRVWNELKKPDICDQNATDKDLLYTCGGYVFLVARKNDCNNVCCFLQKKGRLTFKQVLIKFRLWCIKNNIQYLRVEGSNRRYNFLTHPHFLPELKAEGLNILKDNEIKDRNVFYVKVY